MITEITGHTKLICLLGSPVSHSISPIMHNEAFRLLELDYVYLCFDVGKEGLKTAINGLREINVAGINLTMPNKSLMYEYADELSESAKLIGAVNIVVIDNGKFIGHNTDGIGYIRSLNASGHEITGEKMTLLGSGSAATAIAIQAALEGLASIDIFCRDASMKKAQINIADKINKNTGCIATIYDLQDQTQLKRSIGESYVLTNTSSVGMAPNVNKSLVNDVSFFRPDLIVSDIIYNPKETMLLRQARQAGSKTYNGLGMLLYQGAVAFELWTNHEMPIPQIREKVFS